MKHLLFDADGTLYDFSVSEHFALTSLFQDLSIPYTAENIATYQKGNKLCWKLYEEGEMTMQKLRSERFRLFFEAMDLDYDHIKAGDDYTFYLGEKSGMFSGAEEFLERMHGKAPLHIITNGIPYTQHKRFAATGTEKYFQNIFISDEIGTAKPDPGFFSYVLDRIGIPKDQAIVIGDGENSDIKGARNSGILSIFISFSGKKSEMADYSVSSYSELEALLDDLLQLDIEDKQ